MRYSKKQRVIFFGAVPSCTEWATYESWKSQARLCLPSLYIGFCEDCTSAYQSAMNEQARCENPQICFHIVEGIEEGYLPKPLVY